MVGLARGLEITERIFEKQSNNLPYKIRSNKKQEFGSIENQILEIIG